MIVINLPKTAWDYSLFCFFLRLINCFDGDIPKRPPKVRLLRRERRDHLRSYKSFDKRVNKLETERQVSVIPNTGLPDPILDVCSPRPPRC